MSLNFYATSTERVCYVGWLLACDAAANTAKGERLLKQLTEAERQQAQHHALHLSSEYGKATEVSTDDEDADYQASINRNRRGRV